MKKNNHTKTGGKRNLTDYIEKDSYPPKLGYSVDRDFSLIGKRAIVRGSIKATRLG